MTLICFTIRTTPSPPPIARGLPLDAEPALRLDVPRPMRAGMPPPGASFLPTRRLGPPVIPGAFFVRRPGIRKPRDEDRLALGAARIHGVFHDPSSPFETETDRPLSPALGAIRVSLFPICEYLPMSSDAKRARGQAAATVRALLLHPERVCGPREPVQPLTIHQLLAGGEWQGWDARSDVALRAMKFLEAHPRCSARVNRRVGELLLGADLKLLRAAREALIAETLRDNAPIPTQAACSEFASVLLLAAATLGDPVAAQKASSLALNHGLVEVSRRSPFAWWYFRAAILWARDGVRDYSDFPYVPQPHYPRLENVNVSLPLLAEALGIAAEGLRMVEDEDDLLRDGVGVPSPSTPPPGPLEDFDPLDLDDHTYGANDEPPPKPPPSLIVLAKGALDHLPGSPESGGSSKPGTTASSPRPNWQPWCGWAAPLVHGADLVAAREALEAEAPWWSDVTNRILTRLAGSKFTKLPPILFVGGPGSGKTRYARRLAESLGLPVTVYAAAGTADGSLGGTSRQWSTGRECLPLQAMRRAKVANPAILVDEIEKASTRTDNGRVWDVLLGLLEPEGARRYLDPYLEAPADLSAVSWLATANTLEIPAPLRDRFLVVQAPEPRAEDLPVLARTIVASIRDDRGLDDVWLPDLDGEELDVVAAHWRGGSLRPLQRMIETLLAGRDTHTPRH